jgi:hypothetical protein
LRLTAKRDRDVLHEPIELHFRRFFLLLGNVFQIHFAHMEEFLIYPEENRFLVAMEKTAIPVQIKFTKEEG